MLPLTRVPLFLVCLSHALQVTVALPVGGAASHKDELVLVDEALHYADYGENATAALITLEGAVVTDGEGQAVHHRRNLDNESMMDTSAAAADDLIFLTVKMPAHLQQEDAHHHSIHGIDLLAAEDLSVSCSSSCESHGAGAGDVDDGGDEAVPREIELQTDDLSPPSSTSRSIDMRDFVALIPADEVKSIVANYYRNDPEVQRAYAYLSGRDFAELKQRIIAVPAMSAFLRYLNASGLDVVGFFHTLTNLTIKPAENVGTQSGAEPRQEHPLDASTSDDNENTESTSHTAAEPNTTTTTTALAMPETAITTTQTALLSIKDATVETTTTATTMTATTTTTTTTSESVAAESLNGLHGLVDSILDVLPQDQILTTFFDELETNERFSKLVDNVGSPEFAKILQNMESSVELRNLIFTLHNNGIYITRIVDSLKAYFFLGTF